MKILFNVLIIPQKEEVCPEVVVVSMFVTD